MDLFLFQHSYNTQKKSVRQILHEATKHGVVVNYNPGNVLAAKSKNYARNIFHDDTHFIHDILHTMS